MTQLEFMKEVDAIRASSLELSAKIGMGGGASYPQPELKYPSVPNLHYYDEQKTRKEKDCLRELSICAHYDILHSKLLTLINSYGPSYKGLPMVCKTAVKHLEDLLLYNCSYEYQEEVKKSAENTSITI